MKKAQLRVISYAIHQKEEDLRHEFLVSAGHWEKYLNSKYKHMSYYIRYNLQEEFKEYCDKVERRRLYEKMIQDFKKCNTEYDEIMIVLGEFSVMANVIEIDGIKWATNEWGEGLYYLDIDYDANGKRWWHKALGITQFSVNGSEDSANLMMQAIKEYNIKKR